MTTKTTVESHDSMFDAVLARLDVAAKIYGLSEEVTTVLRNPQKQVKVSLPIMMDNGKMEVFEGLVYTVVKHALMMNNMEIPAAMQKHDIFRMESAFVISGKMEMKEMLQNTF